MHSCEKSTVKFYDKKKGVYYTLDNVLVPKEMNDDAAVKGVQRLRIRHRVEDKIDNDVGYCVKRKLSSCAYGSVYKGFVVKRRMHRQTIISPKQGLDVIREDDELLGSASDKHSYRCNDNDDNFVWELTNKSVIIKTASWGKLRSMRGKHLEDPLKEIQALQLLEGSTLGDHHPHVIHSQVALQDDKYLYNITPYCKDGDLCGVVMNEINSNSRMDEKNARHWFRQILLALHHLQQKGVCHRDIALENIVVQGESCKLIDFGLALRVPFHHPSNMGCVTDVSDGTSRLLIVPQGQSGDFTYMSPETLNADVFDGFGIDLWSVAVILYIMLVGCKPFKWPHRTDEQFMRLAVDGMLRESLSYWEIKLSDEAIDLVQNMLRYEKGERLTLAEVMEHPWVTSSIDTKKNKDTTSDKKKVTSSVDIKKNKDTLSDKKKVPSSVDTKKNKDTLSDKKKMPSSDDTKKNKDTLSDKKKVPSSVDTKKNKDTLSDKKNKKRWSLRKLGNE